MSKRLNVSKTTASDINLNIIGNEQQYIDHFQSVQPTDVTFLIENPSQYVQPETGDVIINKFPSQGAFDSQASNLTWSDVSVIYEENDFVDKGDMFVYFYDYDGSVAYKYNIDEFFILDELPPLPDHSDINKVCDNWNWTLQEIRDYLELYPADINVGCTVHCGNSPELGSSHVRFYDYEGSLLYDYTAAQFLALGSLPALPNRTSENLTCDGWNWTLAGITSHLGTVDSDVNVGAVYHTTDGNTHITCKPTETYPQAHINLTPTVANAVTVAWGDGTTDTWATTSAETKSHTYTGVTDSGVYDITVSCTSGTYSFSSYIAGSVTNNNNCLYTNIKLSNKVTSLGNNCFNGCNSLQSITIPNSVTSFGDYCFQECYSLKSITVPGGIASLGICYFNVCNSLQSITIPNSVTSFGNYCFQHCYSLKSVTIPNGVTSLGENCFSNCYLIKYMILPNSVTSIGQQCFRQCDSMQSINIPSGVTTISFYCFNGCGSLKYITVPRGVTSLNYSCFGACSSMKSISIPNSVTSIVDYCFSNCSSLESITIPSGVTSIPVRCFENSQKIKSFTIPSGVTTIGNYAFSGIFSKFLMKPTTPPSLAGSNSFSSSDTIYVPTGTLSTYKSATNWSSLSSKMNEYNSLVKNTSITNSDKNKKIFVDNIPSYNLLNNNICVLKEETKNYTNDINFYDYDGTLLYSYSNTEFLSFDSLPNLPNRTSENLTHDGWNWTLQEIKDRINNVGGVVNVGAICHTTDGKTHITCRPTKDYPYAHLNLRPSVARAVTVDWGDGSTDTWYYNNFYETKSHTYTNLMDYEITITCSSGTYSFGNYITGSEANNKKCTYTDIKLSNKVSDFGQFGLYYCSFLQSINIPVGIITSSNSNFFANCYSLKSITIPSGVDEITSYFFSSCYSLQSISIPNSITSIGYYCFSGCRSLKSITIPSGVESLGSGWFNDCRSLEFVTIPNSVTSIGGSCFRGCFSLKSINIPNSVTSLDDNCFNDCYSLQSITIPSGVTSLGYYCFGGCRSLQSVTIPGTVTNIGNYCFNSCVSLQSANIENGVTSLGNNCFNSCVSLQSVTIPNTITSLSNSCFSGCKSLPSINIPNNVTSIGSSCFSSCISLQSINIPNGVTSLGDNCFSGCYSLESINIPNSVTTITSYCFNNCRSLHSITIPNSVTSLGDYCFQYCYSLRKIYMERTTPPTLSNTNGIINNDSLVIYVPTGTLSAYQSASNWSTFASKMVEL